MGIELFKSAYTQRQLRTMLISSRVKYDPMSYKLKGDIVPYVLTERKLGIDRYNTDCELNLYTALIDAGYDEETKCKLRVGTSLSKSNVVDTDDGHNLDIRAGIVIANDNVYLPMDLIAYSGNYSTGIGVTAKNVPKTISEARKMLTGLLEPIIDFVGAVTHPASIIPHMMWLEDARTCTLNDAVNFQNFKDLLKHKKVVAPDFVHGYSRCTLIPSVHMSAAILASDAIAKTFYERDYKYGVNIGFGAAFRIILYGIEVLHTIKTLPKESREALFQMLALGKNELVEKYLYTTTGTTIVLHPEVERITDIEDAATRWEQIQNYVHRKEIYDDISTWSAEYADRLSCTTIMEGFHEFPAYLALLVQCCVDMAIRHFRIEYIKLLYNEIKKNGLSVKPDTDSLIDSVEAVGFSEEIKEVIGKCDDEYARKEAPSLMAPHCEGAVPTGDKKPTKNSKLSPPTMDALDREEAKWEDDRYDFVVKDIIDTDDPDAKDKYEKIANCAKLVNRRLIKQLKEIKTYNTGGKMPSLVSGKIDRKRVHLYRQTDKIFYNNTYKIKESDLAFGIVLDASGSMSGDGIRNGRITMIVLHETLKALGINHSIITHTSHGRHNVILERYQAFREDKQYTTRKNYALCKIKAHTGNCDSGALYYMEQALLRTKNKDKICLIFSDGQPTECTGAELRDQVAHMERNHIKVIGIGIDYPTIADYYPNNANGVDLKGMLDIVVEILKQYVLDKKD